MLWRICCGALGLICLLVGTALPMLGIHDWGMPLGIVAGAAIYSLGRDWDAEKRTARDRRRSHQS